MESRATEDPDEAPDIGLARIPRAAGFALSGLAGAWRTEGAFRQEVVAAIVLVPIAILLPLPVLHRLALACSVLLVMVVELVNSGIEAAIDRISLERHDLSKRAKDCGSAAVLVAILIAAATWVTLLGSWLLGLTA